VRMSVILDLVVSKAIDKGTEFFFDKVSTWGQKVGNSLRKDAQKTEALSLLYTDVEELVLKCEGERGNTKPEVQELLKTLATLLSTVHSFIEDCSKQSSLYQRVLGVAKEIVYDGALHADEVVKNFQSQIKIGRAYLVAAIIGTCDAEV